MAGSERSARAWLNLRTHTGDRASIVEAGLRRLGFSCLHGMPPSIQQGDILVTWNRIGEHVNSIAQQFKSIGNKVVVMENSYLGNEIGGKKFYALSLNHHNGAGEWPRGEEKRWESLGIELAPFRDSGTEILILPQRGIGEPGVKMPSDFEVRAAMKLSCLHKRIRSRPHPGKNISKAPTLDHDLESACGAATWGSSAALYALRVGVPVIAFWKSWIGASACRTSDQVASGFLRDEEARLQMFQRLAWSIWSWDEIATGEAFSRYLAI